LFYPWYRLLHLKPAGRKRASGRAVGNGRRNGSYSCCSRAWTWTTDLTSVRRTAVRQVRKKDLCSDRMLFLRDLLCGNRIFTEHDDRLCGSSTRRYRKLLP